MAIGLQDRVGKQGITKKHSLAKLLVVYYMVLAKELMEC